MTPAQLKALLAQGITEFAIYRTPITQDLPYGATSKRRSIRDCPTGLAKATVIEDGAKWEEQYTFGCGDQVHTTPRRNGVLVEFELPVVPDKTPKQVENTWKKRRAKIVKRDGQIFVHLIVSRKAIQVPWGEYALVEAEREKIQAESDERYRALYAVADALGIPRRTDKDQWHWDRASYSSHDVPSMRERDSYHQGRYDQAHVVAVTERFGSKYTTAFFGTVEMPMDHGQKLARIVELSEHLVNGDGPPTNVIKTELAQIIGEVRENGKPTEGEKSGKKAVAR